MKLRFREKNSTSWNIRCKAGTAGGSQGPCSLLTTSGNQTINLLGNQYGLVEFQVFQYVARSQYHGFEGFVGNVNGELSFGGQPLIEAMQQGTAAR